MNPSIKTTGVQFLGLENYPFIRSQTHCQTNTHVHDNA